MFVFTTVDSSSPDRLFLNNKGCPLYFRGSCYQIYTVPKNQDEAEAVCQQNGYHLATINTVEEHHFVQGQTQRLDRKLFKV